MLLTAVAFAAVLLLSMLLSPPPQHRHEKTVVIIGSGLAGLSAAVTLQSNASNPTIRIVLMEKSTRIGGNSAKATSGINGLDVNTPEHRQSFITDTMGSGGELSSQALVRVLVDGSHDAIAWLNSLAAEQHHGPLDAVTQLGGHAEPRTHRFAPVHGRPIPVGATLVKIVEAAMRSRHAVMPVNVMTDTRVINIDRDDDAGCFLIDAVRNETESVRIQADAVIVTSGGYGHNMPLLNQVKSQSSQLRRFGDTDTMATTNGDFATGDALQFLTSNLDASVEHLEQVQVHPTAFVDPANPQSQWKMLAPEALRGEGSVLLSPSGKRFVNELERRDVVTDAIIDHCTAGNGCFAWLVWNQDVNERFGVPAVEFYRARGVVSVANGMDALAQALSVDREVLVASLIDECDKAAHSGRDAFGKTVFKTHFAITDVFYYAKVMPAVHYTMGGIAIDPQARVLSDDKTPIAGLFAAGEVTSGVHGKNRLGGNSLLECAVFGRIAGQSALRYLHNNA